jgi:hypothetical protein
MARRSSPFCCALLGALTVTFGCLYWGCSRTPTNTQSSASNAATPAACSSNKDCAATKSQCVPAQCDRGVCSIGHSPKGARCQLDLVMAERQADLVPSELNELGVCYDSLCMPRLLCMQHCGEQIAKALSPSVKVSNCTDERDCSPVTPDPAALQRAEAGLQGCLSTCGFATPEQLVTEPPKRVPDPRPVPSAEPEPEPEPSIPAEQPVELSPQDLEQIEREDKR